LESGVGAAIDCQVRAGDVGGFRARDECDQRGDFLDSPIAVERGGGDLRRGPIAGGGVQIRVDGAGLDVIDGDAPVADPYALT